MNMKDNKSFDESKLEAAEIKLTSSSTFMSKISNFWYYHKWKVIIIGFFAIVLVVCAIQLFRKEEIDSPIIIAVPEVLDQEQLGAIDNTLSQFLPADVDGDGKKILGTFFYSIYTEEEMEEANTAETDTDGNYVAEVTQYYISEQFKQYSDYLGTGNCSVMIVSEDLYSRLKEADRVLPLQNSFGEAMPSGAMEDGFGVRLGDTYIYEYSPELRVLPEDSVICLLRAYVIGSSSNEEFYAASKQFFKNIVTFGEH